MSLETAGPTKPPIEGDLASSSVGKRHDLALGVERLGLISLRFPWLVAIVALGLAIAAVFGIERIKVDDLLSQLFRSNTKEFQAIRGGDASASRRTSSTCWSWSRARRCSQRENLEKLRDFVTDLQLVDGTRGLISLFSARQAPAPGKLPAALFPDDLPQGADYDKFIETVKVQRDHPRQAVVRGRHAGAGRAVARPGRGRQQRARPDRRRHPQADGRGSRRHRPQRRALRRSGHAARNPQRGRARRARPTTCSASCAGCIIAIIFFRKISFMIVAAVPAA